MNQSPRTHSPTRIGVTALMATMIAALSACGGGDAISQSSLKTEAHFISTAALPAGASDIVVMHLETSQDSDAVDTETLGTDCFPYRFDAEQSLRLNLHEDSHAQSMVLSDGGGQVVAQADRTTPSELVTLKAGEDYTLCVRSDDSEAQTHFFRVMAAPPVATAALTAEESSTLLSASPHCPSCDLHGVQLPNAKLANADLTSADLSGSNFSGSNLRNAILTRANLQAADFSSVLLNSAFVNSATLDNTNFSSATLEGAHLQGSSINGTNFTQALLFAATWVDGSTLCSYNSVGYCNMDGKYSEWLAQQQQSPTYY